MRLNDFKTIDELLEISKAEFLKRANVPPLYWMPSRQHVYTSQCEKYSDMLQTISNCSNEELIQSCLNPSQFIKAAQDYQLSARVAGKSKDDIVATFLRLGNIGMMLKRYYYEMYKESDICLFSDPRLLNSLKFLNGILRAYSEELYLDDHTISGEFYGYENGLVIRVYKRMKPDGLWECTRDFDIEKIETFCTYSSNGMDFDCLGNPVIGSVRPVETGFNGFVYYCNGSKEILSTPCKVDSLVCKLSKYIKDIHTEFTSMNGLSQETILVETAYYAFKPILALINEEYVATKDDIKRYHQSFRKRAEFDKVSEKKILTDDEIMRIIDPRREL